MKRQKLIKFLRKNGCELFREGGNHSIFLNTATGNISAVPRHNEIKKLTVRNICKDLEIPIPNEN
ncbi:MAG: type II toxin-antitoxin system HicA family toxin [Prolixibacteraceae bacterium]|jgi:mRNA interferase HicA|nr:type II toxin-antitoxin system HicA family toxin [Prolixibacteraceae bacterium]